jgi:hypothetical protein
VPAFNKFEIGLVHIGFGLKLGFSGLGQWLFLDAGQFFWTLDFGFSGCWFFGSGFIGFFRISISNV